MMMKMCKLLEIVLEVRPTPDYKGTGDPDISVLSSASPELEGEGPKTLPDHLDAGFSGP